jgi:hypothetical protein
MKTLEEILETLVLHKGRWAVDTEEGLYLFPEDITLEEAKRQLTKAYEYNKTKSN